MLFYACFVDLCVLFCGSFVFVVLCVLVCLRVVCGCLFVLGRDLMCLIMFVCFVLLLFLAILCWIGAVFYCSCFFFLELVAPLLFHCCVPFVCFVFVRAWSFIFVIVRALMCLFMFVCFVLLVFLVILCWSCCFCCVYCSLVVLLSLLFFAFHCCFPFLSVLLFVLACVVVLWGFCLGALFVLVLCC